MARSVREPAVPYKTVGATRAALLDVNVLIALLDSDHLHHQRASAWLEDHLESGWASCAITQNGCVRIMSQPGYPGSLPAARVAERLRDATATVHHRFVADAPSLLDTQHHDTERLLGHRQVTDGLLARPGARQSDAARDLRCPCVIGQGARGDRQRFARALNLRGDRRCHL